MSAVASVQLATVLRGAEPFKEGNINDTFRGQVVQAGGTISMVILKDVEAKELANELIAFVLAKALSLPVPTALLAQVDTDVLPASKGPMTTDGKRLIFASVDVGIPNIQFRYRSDVAGQSRLLGAVRAWPNLGRLYGFDSWIANVDRHAGNLLFGSGAEAYLIDHGWSFTGPRWAANDLDPAGTYANRLEEWLTPILSDGARQMRLKQATALESDLRMLNLHDILQASRAPLLLSRDELSAAQAFLEKRIKDVARHAGNALGVPVIV